MVERRAVVLLSGGLDSTTSAAIARSQGFTLYALTFDYGQRHRIEIEKAADVAKHLGVTRHIVVPVDLRRFGGSALTSEIDVPKARSLAEIGHGIPVTYVPARNTIFLSFALAWAEVLGAHDIYIGVNAVDYSGYPDCRPEYVAAFEKLAALATKAGVEGGALAIRAPLVNMSKAQIIREGTRLGVDYAMTVSCYQADSHGKACGSCDSCRLRRDGFAAAGVPDPTNYSAAKIV
jgi:7-cyano-7-deazaguanine synthase